MSDFPSVDEIKRQLMPQWEYSVKRVAYDMFSIPGFQEILNSFGAEGWELIWEEKGLFVFKRPAL